MLTSQLHDRMKKLAFETRWWPLYPRKVARIDALKAWCQVIKTQADVDTCMANTPLWAAHWTDATYTPYPATYLRKGYWQDPPPSVGRPEQPRSEPTPIGSDERLDNARYWATELKTHQEWQVTMRGFAEDTDQRVREVALRALGESDLGV